MGKKMGDFFYEYFLKPIETGAGFNVVNTVAYAAVALVAAYLIFKLLEKEGVEISERLVYSIIPFVLFGSSMRVVTDAVESGALLLGGFYARSLLTVTPGVYFVVGLTTLFFVVLLNRMKRMALLPVVGLVLFLPHLFLLFQLMKNFEHFAFVALLGLVGAALALVLFKRALPILLVFSHSFDGASTFVSVSLMGGYFEQHVFAGLVGSFFGSALPFYFIKIGFALLASYAITRAEAKESERNYLFLLLIIFGLAPGARNALRLLSGV